MLAVEEGELKRCRHGLEALAAVLVVAASFAVAALVAAHRDWVLVQYPGGLDPDSRVQWAHLV